MPKDTDWTLKAGVRYGRSNHRKHFHESVTAGTRTSASFFGNQYICADFASEKYQDLCAHGYFKDFDDLQNASSEQHAMLDFTLGKDVGMGTFGKEGVSGILSAGVRIAQFNSQSSLDLGSDPNYNLPSEISQKYHDTWEFASQERRSFHGVGPEVTWDASHPVFGSEEYGTISIDWGVNAAVLFGRQRSSLHHAVRHCVHSGFGTLVPCDGGGIFGDNAEIVEPADDIDRSRTVTVPNIGGYLGASMRYRNGKVSFGYRADTFFGAMDGGEEITKSYNRGF